MSGGVRDAEITIVGGGAVGCAVAYALARAGYPDIQVVERGELAGATSGQAAGLVGQVRATRERCRLAMASVALYSRIEQETGYTADWRQTGSRSRPGDSPVAPRRPAARGRGVSWTGG